MTMTFPVGHVHIELDISIQGFDPADPNNRMNKIWPGLPIPKSELHNLDGRSVCRLEHRTECAGIP